MLELNYEELKDANVSYDDVDDIIVDMQKHVGCYDLAMKPIRIKDKNLIIVEGSYLNYDPEIDEYVPDWALTAIYENCKDEEFDYEKFMYIEQSQPATAVHNFLRFMGNLVKL